MADLLRIDARGFRWIGAAVGTIGVLLACSPDAPPDDEVRRTEVDDIPVVFAATGVFTEAQAERGAAVFDNNCQECHQPDLSGGKGPPLTGPDFLSRWGAEDMSLADLYGFSSMLMPEYDPGALSGREYVDVLAFILARNGFPPGDGELPTDMSRLERITLGEGPIVP